MIHQRVKDVLFSGAYLLGWPMYLVARITYGFRARRGETFALHLGCGPEYIDGMVNVDGNLFRQIDLWHDLRRRLPFPDRSVHFVYSCHTLEHLYPDAAFRLLCEIERVLSPGSVARIAVPSLEHALTIAAGRAESRWPRSFDGSRAQAINYLFCDGQHRYGYSADLLREISEETGLRVSEVEGPLTSKRESYEYRGYRIPPEPAGSLVVDLRQVNPDHDSEEKIRSTATG
jgi:predicted SAM-dependent methyltransferase